MKSFAIFSIFLAAAAAQNPAPKLNCENNGGGSAARHCEMREQTVAYAGQLTVDGRPNGGVTVRGWSRGDVLVRMRIEARADNEGAAKALAGQVRPVISAGRISAEGPSAGGSSSWSVSYEIFAPSRSNVEITTQNGGVHLEDLHGRIKFNSTNGGVHMARVDGDVKGATTNGGLHIELAGARWDGSGMDVETTNGGVHMQVPANYSAQLEASTSNGGMHVDFAAPASAIKSRHIQTTLGSGGALLKVGTTNGGVHVSKI